MKKISLILLSTCFAATLAAQEYRGVVTLEGRQLRETDGNLLLDLGIHIRSGAVAECEMMRLTPELTDGENSMEFPFVDIQGRHRRRMNERWESLRPRKMNYEQAYATVNAGGGDELLEYSMRVPYQQWMDDARLVVHQELIGCRNEFRLFTFAMGNRVELESREAFSPEFEVAFVEPARENKRRTKQGQAFLDFPSGQSAILPSYRRNPEELAKIRDAFYEIRNNPETQIQGLYIEGFASPEGRYTLNERLARERSYALRDYMKYTFGLPENMFKVDYTAEDWDGLTALVTASNIAYRNEILEIIATTAEPDAREARLRRLGGGGPWTAMSRDMFPQLRRVEYQIDYSVKDFTEDEVIAMMDGSRYELLSQREFYLAAQSLGKDSPRFEEILLDRIPRHFPDDPAALNNAAAVLLGRGETATAMRYLERAGDSPSVWNNMGIAYMLSGELDKAEGLLRRASESGIRQSLFNLEQLRLKREDNVRMERYKGRQ